MPVGFWYWLILVLMIISNFIWGYVPPGVPWWRARAWHFWLLILLIIIGFKDFGSPWAALVNGR